MIIRDRFKFLQSNASLVDFIAELKIAKKNSPELHEHFTLISSLHILC